MMMAGLAAADFVHAEQDSCCSLHCSLVYSSPRNMFSSTLRRRQRTSTSDSSVETTIAACGTRDKLAVQRDLRATLIMTPEMYRKSVQSSDLPRINGFLTTGRRFNFRTGTNRQQMATADHCLCAFCNEQLIAAQRQAADSFSILQTVSASTVPPYTSTYRSWNLHIVEKAE
ncbi:unnamed protein product [Sphagnum troendelagicum]